LKQLNALFLGFVIALPVWAGGDSSDGHTHAAPEPVLAVAVAPRAVATTEEFEVVAVVEGTHLMVYVDRFASNEPVAKAKVEVEGAGLKGFASESAAGTYIMNLAAAIVPGKHPLTISIEAGDTADLLSATLDTSVATAAAVHVHSWSEWMVWSVGSLVLLASGALLALRRSRRKARGL
jgi:hypothetical protein